VIAMVAFAVIALLVDVSSTISNAPVNITPSMIPTLWDTIVSGSYLIALIVTLLFLVFLFAYYVLSPYVSTLVFAAVGILASTFARTRGNGVIAAAGLRVALWVFSYVASQFVGITIQLMFVPFFMLQSPPLWLERLAELQPSIIIIGGVITGVFVVLLTVISQSGAAMLMLLAAERRLAKIPVSK